MIKQKETFTIGIMFEGAISSYYSKFGRLTEDKKFSAEFKTLKEVREVIDYMMTVKNISIDNIFVTRNTYYIKEEEMSPINVLALLLHKKLI